VVLIQNYYETLGLVVLSKVLKELQLFFLYLMNPFKFDKIMIIGMTFFFFGNIGVHLSVLGIEFRAFHLVRQAPYHLSYVSSPNWYDL
jgi:hypothetical protein